MFSSDIENGPVLKSGHTYAGKRFCWGNDGGSVVYGGFTFYKISPTSEPAGAEVNLAEDPEAVATV